MQVTSRSEAPHASVTRVRQAVEAMPRGRWLLAVSGGRDSMALLDAVVASRREEIAGIATFDHGSGDAARAAVGLVVRSGLGYQLPVVTGSMEAGDVANATEARWRSARWRFLAAAADHARATVMTAHSRDDQAETVFLRILRGAAARGLAGMASLSPSVPGLERPSIARPLLGTSRADIAAYAIERAIEYIDDPTNADTRFARNRVRSDLLPAFERVDPGFADWLVDLGARAGECRARVEGLVDALAAAGELTVLPNRAVVLRPEPLVGIDEAGWRLLWPAIAARAGVALDRRGIARAAEFASRGDSITVGGRIQLAGRVTIERTRSTLVLRPDPGTT